MHLRIQIKNATLVNEGRSFKGSLVIDDDRIDEIKEGFNSETSIPVDEVINGEGCYVLPGVIDEHVHFRDPGFTDKGDFATESRAAAAGGVTTVLDMPNCLPQTTTLEALSEKQHIAAEKSVVNYGFFFGATAGNAYLLSKLDPRKVAGIKLFMGASTGNMLVDNPHTLEAIFDSAKLPIMVHCEDTHLIGKNMEMAQKNYGNDPSICYHSQIRSEEACYKSTKLAIELAHKAGKHLHIAHLSTAKELSLIDPTDPLITAEACVGHLLYCDNDYTRLGARIKVNPAIKTQTDRDALRSALNDGRIFTIATDHAPHKIAEKIGGCKNSTSGMPLIQFSLISMLELVEAGILTIERLVELMSHNPANLFNIENRGFLREGYMADIVMVRPHVPWTLTPNRIQSKCNWSPLEGHTFHWRVERTFCNGFPIYNRGHVTDEMSRGKAICYNR